MSSFRSSHPHTQRATSSPRRRTPCALAALALLAGSSFAMAQTKYLLLAADNAASVEPVRNSLLISGLVTDVDIYFFSSTLPTPDLNELLNYDAVLTWTNLSYADGEAMGNVLADYVDAGGAVVCAVYTVSSNTANRSLTGRWQAEGYDIIPQRSGTSTTTTSLGAVHLPSHPLWTGMTGFAGGTNFARSTTTSAAPHAVRIADWANGGVLVAASSTFPKRVDLNFFPPAWHASPDGIQLLANALVLTATAGNTAPGGCCFPDGTCQVLSAVDCLQQGGSFRGASTTCNDPCLQPGACCFDDGTCEHLIEPVCVARSGVWYGAGSDCATAGCPQPGACCFANGGCAAMGMSACATAGGNFSGHGTTCAAICPPPSDVLVPPDFFAEGAAGGGPWVYTPMYTQSITGTGEANAFRLKGQAHPRIGGFAFQTDMQMQLVSPSGISLLVGGGTVNWNNALFSGTAPAATGNAGTFDGVYVHDFGPLDGDWSVNFRNAWSSSTLRWTDLEITPLSLPTGACCMNDGSCSTIVELLCNATGGNYAGDGTACASYACPQPGACCLDTGCTMLIESQCIAFGGNFQGEAVPCATANCPPATVGATIGFNFTTAISPTPDPRNWNRISTAVGTLANAQDDTGTPTEVSLQWSGGVSGNGFLFLTTASLAANAVPQHTYDLAGMSGYGYRANGAFTLVLSGLEPSAEYDYWVVANRGLGSIANHIQVSSGDTINATSFHQSILSTNNDGRFIVNETIADSSMVWNALAKSTISSSAGTITINHAGAGETPVLAALALRKNLSTPCYANCDNSTTIPVLNVDDFTCFINAFAGALSLPPQQQITHYANCDNSTTTPVLNVDDFTCFINAFAAGCP